MLNVGTIGHVDHGKTTLSAALSSYFSDETTKKSFAQIDNAPEETRRGISMFTSIVQYKTSKRSYTHYDCPGHNDYVKQMISGSHHMDAAILLVSAEDGPMPQTREHLLLARRIGIEHIIVFINKIDLVYKPDVLQMVESETRSELERQGYQSAPIIFGSAKAALEGTEQGALLQLAQALDNVPMPPRKTEQPFVFGIDSVFELKGRGWVATGQVEQGIFELGSELELLGRGEQKTVKPISLQSFGEEQSVVVAGENVGMLFSTRPRRGQIITAPGLYQTTKTLELETYVLLPIEGGRRKPFFSGFRAKAYLRGYEETGVFLAKEDMVMPGDNALLELRLPHIVAHEPGLKIVIRDQDQTVGIGVVI